MVSCPSCALELPARARFCARCGTAIPDAPPAAPVSRPARRQAPPWLIVVFTFGTLAAAFFGLVYGTLAISPEVAYAGGLDIRTIREGALIVAGYCLAMFLLQGAAVGGLVTRRGWGRVVAILACGGWAVTCIGAPICAVVLYLWRRDRLRP